MTAKQKTNNSEIEKLARMVKRGFVDVTSPMATKHQIQLLSDNQDLMRVDITDIKRTLGPLV